jgi:membrane protein insertase Oxa1/YidC/SpoIIIJ
VVATSFYQQRQVTARRSGGSAVMNPQQEMIMKFLPLLSGIWSFVFPAGLVLYWATSNVFRIGQQAYITRAYYHGRETQQSGGAGGSESNSGDSGDDGGKDPKDGDEKASGGKADSAKKGDRPKFDKPKSSSNGDRSSDNGSDDGKKSGSKSASREEAWAKRRQEKARVQAANKNRREQASRVTPKGTKPASSKKKRKR